MKAPIAFLDVEEETGWGKYIYLFLAPEVCLSTATVAVGNKPNCFVHECVKNDKVTSFE
jgi:hypothetical protein